MTNEQYEKRWREHQRNLAEQIVQCVREGGDEEEVARIMDTPMPITEHEMHEDSMGVSPDVYDPCGVFGSIEDLRWFMREYPDCFDDPRFMD